MIDSDERKVQLCLDNAIVNTPYSLKDVKLMNLKSSRIKEFKRTVPAGISEIDAKREALAHTAVQRQLDGKQPQQVVYVAGRLVNIVL